MNQIVGTFCCVLALLLSSCQSKTETAAVQTEPKELFLNNDGVQLFVKHIGEGEPVVVLHGGPGLDHTYLLPQMQKLAKGRSLVFYDQRGCGRSRDVVNKDEINLQSYLSDIEAIRTHLGQQKMTLVGHAWGGSLALHYALRYPDRVEKLVLVSLVPASSRWMDVMTGDYYRRTGKYVKQIAALEDTKAFEDGDPKVIADYYRYIFRSYMFNEDDVDKLTLTFTPETARNSFEVNRLLRREVFGGEFDWTPELSKLTVPTLIVYGTADITPEGAVEEVRHSLKQSQYLRMEQCGHFPYIESADTFFEKVDEFLN